MQKSFIVILFFLLLAIFCYSCKTKQTSDTIIIALRGPSAVSMVYLMDTVETKCQNNKMKVKIVDEPEQVKAAILKKEAAFYALPMNLAAILYNNGASIRLVAVPVWGTLWLAGSEKISNWNEIKGKTIYLLGKGTSPDIVFRFLLQKHGLNPDIDVKLDYSFPAHAELAQAMAIGKAKLAIVSEPFLTFVMHNNPNIKPCFDLEKEWNISTNNKVPFAQTALIVDKIFSEQHPEMVEEFIKIYGKSIDKVNADHPHAGYLASKYKIIPDSSAITESISRCRLKLARADTLKDGIERYLKVFYTFNPKTIGGQLPDEGFYFKFKNQ